MLPEGCLCEGCADEEDGHKDVARSDEEDEHMDLVQSPQSNGRQAILEISALLPAKLNLSIAFCLHQPTPSLLSPQGSKPRFSEVSTVLFLLAKFGWLVSCEADRQL